MSTDQKYDGKESHANSPQNPDLTVKNDHLKPSIREQHRMHVAARADKLIEDNDKVVLAFPTGDTYRTPLAIAVNAFANNLDDIEYLSNTRFAIRSWFSCFIQEDVHPYVHGHSIEQATIYFQDIDDFLSSLIIAKYQEVQYENTQMRGDLGRLAEEFEELEKRTAAIDERADQIEAKITSAASRSNN